MDRRVCCTPGTFPPGPLTFSNHIDHVDFSTGNADLLDSIHQFREKLEAKSEKHKTHLNDPVEAINPVSANKGLALIIDIHEIDYGSWLSDSDTKELSELLYQFNYEVHPKDEYLREKRRKAKKEIHELIDSFLVECNLQNPSSVIVYIGSDGHFPSSLILTSNVRRIHFFQDVVRKFSRLNCPALGEKPKLFITSLRETCNFVALNRDEEFLWHKQADTDAILNLPGSLSRGIVYGGSWLVNFLTMEISKKDSNTYKSFQDILDAVRECIVKIKAGGSNDMLTSIFPDWEIKLLFFPYPSDEQIKAQTGSKISIHKSSLLGEGSFGKVFKGTYENRDVAVKVIDSRHFQLAQNEISTLCTLDRHPNVVFYYAIESVQDSYYIALELCSSNLAEWLDNHKNKPKINRIQILNEICKGVNHIHERGIIHRDLKPDNILVQEISKGEIRILVSDFGFGRKLPEGKHSMMNSRIPLGSYLWMAPDVWLQERLTNAVDIFSLGCIFYFVLTNGHPFGSLEDPILIPGNIRNGRSLLIIPDDTSGITKIIGDMIHAHSYLRPGIASILKHPMFWDNEKKMKFFSDIKSTFTNKEYTDLFEEFEAGRDQVFSGSWKLELEDSVQWEVERKGTYYDFHNIMDLIRLIRNKYEHYDGIDDNVKTIFGDRKEFIMYWLRKFPQLLPYTWESFIRLAIEDGSIRSNFY